LQQHIECFVLGLEDALLSTRGPQLEKGNHSKHSGHLKHTSYYRASNISLPIPHHHHLPSPQETLMQPPQICGKVYFFSPMFFPPQSPGPVSYLFLHQYKTPKATMNSTKRKLS